MIKNNHKLLDKSKTYICAVSMGVDSVAGFWYLKSRGYNVIPLHINHGLRPQNDLMQRSFLKMCHDKNLQFETAKLNFLSVTEQQVEAYLRDQRLATYNYLYNYLRYAVKFLSGVITFHHLNDCVEQYLLNCFRGQPNHNLIPWKTVLNHKRCTVFHPFLLTRKKDFVQYAERNDLMKYVVEDETNTVTKGSRRNWIRNVIIPEMKSQKLNLEKAVTKIINEN